MIGSYSDKVKQIAYSENSAENCGDYLIRNISQLIVAIENYNLAVKHNNTDVDDKLNKLKTAIAEVVVDQEVYAEMLGLTRDVRSIAGKKVDNRVKRKVYGE